MYGGLGRQLRSQPRVPHAGARSLGLQQTARQLGRGGDVYYVSSCASGRITRLLLADVSGHGAAVTGLATGLRDLMRKHVNFVKQSRFVERMNREFAKLAEEGSFATALVATFFQPTRRLTVCNAGHPYPLLFDASEKRWSLIHEPDHPQESGIANMPFGLDDQTKYVHTQTVLDAGDMVLFYSDAITESYDTNGRMRGMNGLLETTSQLNAESPADLLSELLSEVDGGALANSDQDDLTVLLCRATGTGTTLRNNLLAPWRLFRAATDHTVLK
jgi:phosphoserine phosphatase RsbU/P